MTSDGLPPDVEFPRDVGLHRSLIERLRGDGTAVMLAGSVGAGVLAFAWQAVGTRGLGEVAFAPVAAVWTLLYLMSTILFMPVEQFATRTVAAHRLGYRHLLEAGRRLIAIGFCLVVVMTSLAWLARDRMFAGEPVYALVCGAIVFPVGGLFFVRGIMAGRRDFVGYGKVTAADALARLTLGVLVIAFVASPVAFAWTIPLGSVAVLLWLGRVRPDRAVVAGDAPIGVTLGQFLPAAVLSTAASQFVFAGGPLVLAAANVPDSQVTVLFVTQTAFRALMLVAIPVAARLLPTATRMAVGGSEDVLSRVAFRAGPIACAAAVVSGFLAAGLAPPVIAALFGAGTRPSGLVAGLAGAATTLAVANLTLGQGLIARGAMRTLLATQLIALGVWLVVIAAVSTPLMERVLWATLLGELAAVFGLTIAAAIR